MVAVKLLNIKQTNNMPHGKIKLEIWSVCQAECQEVKPLDSTASKLGWQARRRSCTVREGFRHACGKCWVCPENVAGKGWN